MEKIKTMTFITLSGADSEFNVKKKKSRIKINLSLYHRVKFEMNIFYYNRLGENLLLFFFKFGI